MYFEAGLAVVIMLGLFNKGNCGWIMIPFTLCHLFVLDFAKSIGVGD